MGQASLKTPALNGWLPVKSNRTGAGAAEADPDASSLRFAELARGSAAASQYPKGGKLTLRTRAPERFCRVRPVP
jgi:hypothetical protein